MGTNICCEIFSGTQPRKGVKVLERFEDWLRLHLQGATDGLVKPRHHLFYLGFTKPSVAPLRRRRSQSPKPRRTFKIWRGCLPEMVLNSVARKRSRLMNPFWPLMKNKQVSRLWGELEHINKWSRKEGKMRGEQKSVWSGKMFRSLGISLKAGCIIHDLDGSQLFYITLIELIYLLVSTFY